MRILLINMNYLGDALMTLPAIRMLKSAYPDATVDTIAGKGGAATALELMGNLDRVVVRDSKSSFARCKQMYSVLKEGRYTHVVILPALPAYALTSWLARTPVRAGLAGPGMTAFLTHSAKCDLPHLSDRLIAVCAAIIDGDRVPLGNATKASESRHDSSLRRIAIHLGSTREQKRWPTSSFVTLIKSLRDVSIVLVGSGERDIREANIAAAEANHPDLVNLVGKTGIRELTEILTLCNALVTGDSGPMHLAVAVGTPNVALFGSTDPMVTGPYDLSSTTIYKSLPCSPCNSHPTCGGAYTCMTSISAAEVEVAVRQYLV